jgi:DNA primase
MGEGEPKYLNSPETPVFRKGELLYLLDKAGDSIRKNGHAIVVEGYTDAIACHRAGVTNAVATLGTALTEGHLRVLGRYAKKVKLVFDSDAAGQKAAERSLDVFLGTKQKAKVALLPDGDDPDSMVAGGRVGELAEKLRESVGLMEYVIDRLARKSGTVEGKIDAAARLTDILARIDNAVERAHYLKEGADKIGTEEAALSEELNKKLATIKKREAYKSNRQPGPVRKEAADYGDYDSGGYDSGDSGPDDSFFEYYGGASGQQYPGRGGVGGAGKQRRDSGPQGTPAERELIHLMLLHPEIALSLKDELEPGDFLDPELGCVAARIYELLGPDGTVSITELLDGLEDGPGKLLVTRLTAKGTEFDDPDASARDSVLKLKREKVDGRLAELKALIDEASKTGDDELLLKYSKEITDLHKKKAGMEL